VAGGAEGHLLWAAYHRASGQRALAHERAVAALASAAEPRQPLALLAAHRFAGELATAAGNRDDAATHLEAALALATACVVPYERALTVLALGELACACDDRARAEEMLDEGRALCSRLGAKPALTRAAALETRLSSLSAPQQVYPAGLSAREVEVLRLVATGLSNAEVAEHLVLSPRTVEQHLRSIYNKLGVSSRTAATRFAMEHQLT
jgi:DNA-binding NarL/FixJ family response regulator